MKPSNNPENLTALKDKFDYLRDLKPFDEKENLAYKGSFLKNIQNFAKELDYRFNAFKSISGNVLVEAHNT